MRKVLFLMLAMVVGMTAASAQQKVAFKKGDAFKASVTMKLPELQGKDNVVNMDYTPGEAVPRVTRNDGGLTLATGEGIVYESMITYYDLQSNAGLGNRIATWPDGTVAVTATIDPLLDNATAGWPDRGTGYNYFDGEEFADFPEERVEPIKTGWPSIAPLGDGEILTSHSGGIHMFKRDTKGEGDWTEIHQFNTTNYHGYGAGEWTWARVATTHDGQYVHVIMADQFTDSQGNNRNIVTYVRSTDGGETFSEPADPPCVDPENDYFLNIGADDYVIATNGDRVAILFCGTNYDLFYIYSEDNGEHWTKHIVCNFRGDDHAMDPYRTDVSKETDSIWSQDNAGAIAIGNDGTVHVAFTLIRWSPATAESGFGYITYWPLTYGLVYWNSNYRNEAGGENIPDFGQWSGDADLIAADANKWVLNGCAPVNGDSVHGISNTLCDERMEALAEFDGYRNLNFIIPDENHNNVLDWAGDTLSNTADDVYRTFGVVSMPAISIDENDNMIICYSVWSETRITKEEKPRYFRNCAGAARAADGTWFYDAYNINAQYEYSETEAYYVTAAPQGSNGEFWFAYNGDGTPLLYLDSQEQPNPTKNTIYAVRLYTAGVFDAVTEAVNPMTSARVFPNPTNGTLFVEVNASMNSDATLSVFNIMGQKVAEKQVNIGAGINTTSIETNELSNGVYFVTVKANGFEKTMKFVVK